MKRISAIAVFAAIATAQLAAEAPAYGTLPTGPIVGTRPTLETPGSFSMVMMGDPQSYTKFAANQPLWDLQVAWVADNIEGLNIKAALITGDMVEQANKLTNDGRPHPLNGNQTSRQQWEAFSNAMKRLDNRLPYICCQGNHDVGYLAAESRYTMQNDYIYPERNHTWERTLVATCPNYQGVHTMENAAFEFSDPNWGNLLIVATEFYPRDEVLDWIRTLSQSDRFANHRVIILTHAFTNHKAKLIENSRYQLEPRNLPQAVWDKLIADSKNIDMVLCGHAGQKPDIADDAKALEDVDYSLTSSFTEKKRADGQKVPIMMFNCQTSDGEWFGDGGDCWVRILEFHPDGKTIGVRTFSPLFAQSKLTRDKAWRNGPTDHFTITLPKKK